MASSLKLEMYVEFLFKILIFKLFTYLCEREGEKSRSREREQERVREHKSLNLAMSKSGGLNSVRISHVSRADSSS